MFRLIEPDEKEAKKKKRKTYLEIAFSWYLKKRSDLGLKKLSPIEYGKAKRCLAVLFRYLGFEDVMRVLEEFFAVERSSYMLSYLLHLLDEGKLGEGMWKREQKQTEEKKQVVVEKISDEELKKRRELGRRKIQEIKELLERRKNDV